MRGRDFSAGSAVTACGLDDQGEDAGLVAGDDKRDVAVDGDFSLEQLLAGGVDVGRVGERDVAAELLLDGDARSGVAEGAEVVGIELDAAGAKKFLNAAAHGGAERTAEK